MSAPVPATRDAAGLQIDMQWACEGLEVTFALARLAEKYLPEADPGRQALVAMRSSMEALVDAVEAEIEEGA